MPEYIRPEWINRAPERFRGVFDEHVKWRRGDGGAGAYLAGADLAGANLTRADLARANLAGAYLAGANLTGAYLTRANLAGANLAGANLGDIIVPVVPKIDAAILAAISTDDCRLNMNDWHTCATTHCRAGWAIHLAGRPGYELEKVIGSNAAGALIYAKSRPGKPVPNFYASHDDAMADIKACAANAQL